MTVTIDELLIADAPDAWRSVGLKVDGASSQVGAVRLRLTGEEGPRGVRAWSVRGIGAEHADAFEAAEGIRTTASVTALPGPGPVHPLGAIRIDHLVLMTPHLARTVASLEALGLDVRGVRDAEFGGKPMQQVFFRLGEVILEVLGDPESSHDLPATFWGITYAVADLDAAITLLGESGGRPRDAVQPGRRITTVRTRDLGISVATALMTERPAH